MIQRIQTAYLLVAVVLISALFTIGFPLESQAAVTFADWFPAAFYILTVVAVVLCGVAIAQYKHRTTQLRTAGGALLAAFLLLALLVGGFVVAGDLDEVQRAGNVAGYLTVALPFVALVLVALARRAIAADIALVRSMDRLR